MTDNLPPNPTPTGHALRQWLVSLGLLALLTLAMFGNVLFTTDPVVLSNSTTDIRAEYLHWRAFGFDQLRHGNLALWNPDLFCGTPFFGGFQAALLYPPNVLFLILPVGSAINWCIALHVFLAGVFMCVWARWRGLCPPAAFLAGVIYMFCGANFLHVYSGYLPYLCALVWPPLLFLAIDGLMEAFALRWVLLGMFAVAMQVLAGNPQSVFYAGVAAGIYCLLGLFRARDWKKIIVGSLGLALGGVALGAVQLFTGLDESHDMLRNAGVPYDFAAMFSFPPENFLTLLAPHFFGDLKTLSYWGRDYLWEMCLFIGVTGLVLAVLGAVWGGRRRWVSVVMVAVLLLLALGGHTPLFKLLYHWVPGFNQFRGNSKFIFLASMFLALLAGGGMDELLRGRRPPRGLICGVTLAGAALIAFSVAVRPTGFDTPTAAWWHSFLQAVHRLGETYLPASTYNDPTFLLNAGRLACRSLFIAGLLLAAVALLLALARKHRLAVWSLLALAVVELSVFARTSLDQFDLDTAVNKEVKSYLAEHPGNYRILNQEMPDAALSLGAQDMWGYEPGIVRRFAQLMAFARGINPDEAVRLTSDVQIIHGNPLFDLFRCRYDFIPDNGRLVIYEHTNAFPQLLLVQRCRVLADRAKIFSTLTNTAFNPRQEVILEKAPDPQPVVSKDPGQVKLVDSGTDFLTVEADVKTPSILLVTDVYAHGWRARGLAGSVQKDYRIQPADWCLRGIPLAAGHHRLRLEYRPTGFVLGKWVSIFSWLMFLPLAGAMAWRFARNARLSLKPASPASEPSAAESPAPLGDWQWEFKLAPEDRTLLTVLAALVIATFFSYWPVFGADFTNYDDPVYVTENAHVLQGLTWQSFSWAFTNLDAGFWHPLTWLSLLTDMTFYGYYKDAALGFHLTNVLLHIGSTVLLFLVLRRTTGALWRSAIVAALFALHPLHVESVAWVTERKDVLSTFFWMLTLWFYVRYADARQPGAPWTRRAGGNYLLVVLFLCCGLMSKTMLVTLPGVLLAMDYWPLGRVSGFGFGVSGSKTRNPKLETRNWLSLVLEKLPLLALAILAAWGTIRSEAHVGALPKAVNSPLFLRLENTSLNYFRYVFEMFWPSGLTVFYPYPKHFSLWAVMGALTVVVLITIVALRWWQRRPYFIAGWLWYCMTLLPVSGIIQVGSHVAADRYTYVPLTGLFIVVVWGGAEILSRRRCSPVEITGLTALMLGACAFLTVNQARYWENSETLFRHALAVTKNNHIANNNLATYLHRQGKVDDAIPYYLQAVQIDPGYADALNNLGFAYQNKKQYTNAIVCYQAALMADPKHIPAHYNLGLAYGDLGRYQDAIDQFRHVLEIKPDNVSVRYHMGNALLTLGRTSEAIEQYQIVSKMSPSDADDLNNLGYYLAGQGRLDDALAAYHQALEFNPYFPDALNNLGNVLATKKQYPEAITYYDSTLRVNPYYAMAHYNWGNALLNQGKTDDAITQYQAAINTDTNCAEAYYQLGKVLINQGKAADGIRRLRQAIQLKPDSTEWLNNLAWVLATNPDAKSRSGADAVKLATHAVDLTHHENSGYLDTLAAAQAEAGDFAKAVQTEQEATDLEKSSTATNNDGTEMLAHLRLFQSHQAISETVH